ncbi:MAG: NIPSNAP family protein [Pirellulaceae bacterium]|nr:NIPSNAP family protein [Pirellulaceae bacterium]
MIRQSLLLAIPLLLVAPLVVLAEEPAGKLYELRIYKTHPGRLDALNKRFREHTNRLFVKHGMELVGYWTPAEGDDAADTLIYILAYPNREAREAAWKGFLNDPDWKKARDASEQDGKIVLKVESKFLSPTDYSPLK